MPLSRTRPWLALSAAAVLAGGLAVVAPAAASSGSFTQPVPILVEELAFNVATASGHVPLELGSGASTSAVGVSDLPENARATRVSVLVVIEHDSLDDVDLVLMAPNEQAVTLASDIGGAAPVGGSLHFSHRGRLFGDDSIHELGGVGVPTDYDPPRRRRRIPLPRIDVPQRPGRL